VRLDKTVSQSSSILITGGAGFMGSHLVDSVLTDSRFGEARIVVLDDLSGGKLENVPQDPRVEFVRGSINDQSLIKRLFDQHRFRYVYHLAAYAAEGLSHFIRNFNYSNNLLGSVNLINAAIEYETSCFVFTSSIAVYGDGDSPLTEDMQPRPVDPYGIAKFAVELDLAAANQTHGLQYVVFRPHNVYGERQNLADKYRNVVGIFMNRLLRGLPMPIFGDGTQQRAFTHVSDVSPVVAGSVFNPRATNQVFNLGCDRAYTVNQLAEKVAQAMGMTPTTVHLQPRHEVHVAYCGHQKVRAAFPDFSETALEHGLSLMAAWAKEATIGEGQSFEPLEIEKNLPPSWRE
jgi:UDP-glucose 4-epimerase